MVSETGKAAIPADVRDLGNGTYVGTTPLAWPGTVSVQVYLTYPREFLREVVRVRLTLHSTQWIAAQFTAAGVQEVGISLLLTYP